MSERVTMPALGESVTEGTVTRWLKNIGDTVEVDEPLLEVSTDKVDTEIPSPVAGTVLEIKVPEDETADVGAELAIIGTPGSAPAESPAPAAPAPQQAEAPKAETAEAEAESPKAEAPKAEAPKAEAPKPAPQQQSAPLVESKAAPEPAPAAPTQSSAPAAESVKANGAGDAGYVTPLVRKLA